MSVVNNNLLLTADAGVAPSAYQISRSLRFNAPDSAYLIRTPSVAGNRQTWTWAGWIKRTTLSSEQRFLGDVNTIGNNGFFATFEATNVLTIGDYYSGFTSVRTTTQVFRDISSWYHIVITYDTTNATAADRLRLYVNGVRVTSFSVATNPSLNYQGSIGSTNTLNIGRNGNYNGFYFNGYLADVHYINGQALTPSSFTETNATTGQLVPKAYTGTYGTNGFRLNFSNNSAATAATLGADSSGNGNNWTPNNLSVTAGAGNDSLTDTPTSYGTDTGAGGVVRGNYATLNPLSTLTTVTLANGNLDYSSTTASRTTIATIGVSSGSWYWEVSTTAGTTETQVGVYGTSASTLFSLAANSTVYGIRFNADTGALDRTSDGVTFTSIATGLTSGPYFPYFNNNGTTAKVVSVNFGQRPFAYAAPSGFKALCDTNIPEGTITTSGTFTGNASADGPFVYLNGVPTAMTINSNAVTFATHVDKLANGFKVRSSSGTYNTAGTNTYSITTTGAKFKYARAQPNP